ncbi:MAG: tRNA uridine-5-carboxymethylaminomethyl(34) synthesis GTPase MnmE, partial [Elusimicrobia bacterium]|nr:tRNA uridine-5-carboxymethylaminomethyl(34) synthesis GTPase MnmE [Elusimicrobiota bacterium]
ALNKSDLPAAAGPREIPAPCVEVSATRGAGLERLAASIGAALGEGKQAAEGAPLVLTVRHRRALEEADAAVARALPLLEDGELAAVHLRESLSALAAVVGETPSEEVLREIFSRFCVGK